MSKNKILIYATMLIIILTIAIPSTYKVIKKHNDRMLTYTTKKIIEAAKDCYYNESCVENEITLKEIYEKTSLNTMSNPITKKIYSEESYVDVERNFTFIEK